MISIQTLLFDLDGTIIDSEPVATQAVRKCFLQWGIQLDDKDSAFVTGRTWESALQYLMGRYPLELGMDEALTVMLNCYRESMESRLPVIPGAVEAIEAFSDTHRLGLVSGSQRKDILWALKKLKIDHHFEVILGAEDYPKSKPAPDGYLKAIQQLKAQAESTLIFEDSHPGVLSGRAAGAWVVAVTCANHFTQDLSSAHEKIVDFRKIGPDWIKLFSSKKAPRDRLQGAEAR